jgi:hypothetical protein
MTLIQPVLHHHECANPPTKSVATTESAPAEIAADPPPAESIAAESTTEPLHSVADYVVDFATAGAAPTETS